MDNNITEVALEKALVAAKEAHTEFEKQNGPDPDWPKWYARFMHDWFTKGVITVDGMLWPFERRGQCGNGATRDSVVINPS
jgi:hypothetical protein